MTSPRAVARERRREEGIRFARRMYLPRTIGLALGAVCVAGGLWQRGAPLAAYVLLGAMAFVWPHLAYPLARRSAVPYRSELRNLMADSAFGGIWVAYIGFNLVPSAVLVSMLAMDKISIGGPRLLVRCLAAQVAAAAAVVLLFDPPVHLTSSTIAQLASLPLLLGYPSLVGIGVYWLSRRVRQQNQMLSALSTTDALSGLLNKGHWEAAVAEELRRCHHGGNESALVLADVDNFKAINDEHGHPVGDEVISSMANVLRDILRYHDIPGRYGGDEFGVVLPDTDAEGAAALAERIRKRVEHATLDSHHKVRGTVSIGVAVYSPSDADARAWIARADWAMYRAKELGRNRIVHHETATYPAPVPDIGSG